MHPAITRYTTPQDQATACVCRLNSSMNTSSETTLEAGRSAGGYLGEIGKTDLALLSAGNGL